MTLEGGVEAAVQDLEAPELRRAVAVDGLDLRHPQRRLVRLAVEMGAVAALAALVLLVAPGDELAAGGEILVAGGEQHAVDRAHDVAPQR